MVSGISGADAVITAFAAIEEGAERMFEWKDQYSCNINEIDKQHRHLFRLAEDLHELLKSDAQFDQYDDIQRVLGELADYTVYHFAYEEKLLKEHGFNASEFMEHQAEHIAFVNKIRHLQDQDIDRDQRKILMDTLMFAVHWIEKHILDTDKKYVTFLNGQGIH